MINKTSHSAPRAQGQNSEAAALLQGRKIHYTIYPEDEAGASTARQATGHRGSSQQVVATPRTRRASDVQASIMDAEDAMAEGGRGTAPVMRPQDSVRLHAPLRQAGVTRGTARSIVHGAPARADTPQQQGSGPAQAEPAQKSAAGSQPSGGGSSDSKSGNAHPPAGSPPPSGDGKPPPAAVAAAKPQDPEQADAEKRRTWRPRRKSFFSIVLILILATAAVLLILYSWQLPPFASGMQETNDAYVEGDTTTISPQVSGYLVSIPVRDFEFVKAGQILAVIDPASYEAAVAQARASVATSQANLANATQSIRSAIAKQDSAAAAVTSARASLERSRADAIRGNSLVGVGAISRSENDTMQATFRQSEAQLQQAKAGLVSAFEDVESARVNRLALAADVETARSGLLQAQINLDRTVIRSPVDGQLSDIPSKRGQYVSSGTQLMHVVPSNVWVIANFKERQITNMRVGDRVIFTVDALQNAPIRGHIESLSPATGSQYSAIPANNATGNFVKVPQRIPVRIIPDKDDPMALRLKPGLSVVAKVYPVGT